MDADPKSPDSKKDAPRRPMERLVRQFGAVWVASQDGMAAIGATRKDALAGLDDCIKCKKDSNAVSVESTALLILLADIRAAVGDPTGKLMQDELVAHCAEMLKALERIRDYQGRFGEDDPQGVAADLLAKISSANTKDHQREASGGSDCS